MKPDPAERAIKALLTRTLFTAIVPVANLHDALERLLIANAILPDREEIAKVRDDLGKTVAGLKSQIDALAKSVAGLPEEVEGALKRLPPDVRQAAREGLAGSDKGVALAQVAEIVQAGRPGRVAPN